MKVEIKYEPADQKYPYLAVSCAGRIVLFTALGKGMQLCNITSGMGRTSDSWDMEEFTPLNGSITLSN